jgi:hypothetical protein
VATHPIGKDSAVLSGSVEKGIYTYVEKRAGGVRRSRSWYTARIIDFWLSKGAPPLTDTDALNQAGSPMTPPSPSKEWNVVPTKEALASLVAKMESQAPARKTH